MMTCCWKWARIETSQSGQGIGSIASPWGQAAIPNIAALQVLYCSAVFLSVVDVSD